MKTIRYKSRGSDVHALEEILVEIGYTVVVNEFFGKDTHEAVMDFQTKYSLVVDGIVGSKTWSKLFVAQEALSAVCKKLL